MFNRGGAGLTSQSKTVLRGQKNTPDIARSGAARIAAAFSNESWQEHSPKRLRRHVMPRGCALKYEDFRPGSRLKRRKSFGSIRLGAPWGK